MSLWCIAGWALAAVLLALFAWAYTSACYLRAERGERSAWERWQERLLWKVREHMEEVAAAMLRGHASENQGQRASESGGTEVPNELAR